MQPKDVMVEGTTRTLHTSAAEQTRILTSAFPPYYADARRMYQGVPDLEVTPGGRFWAAWMAGGYDEDLYNYILVASSEDRGASWVSPRLIVDPDRGGPIRTFDPCLWRDPKRRLWLFWTQGMIWPGEYTGGLWAIRTDDPDSENPTWSEPRRIGGGILQNKPVVLSSGEWLLPVAHWREDVSARVYLSNDDGESFQDIGGASIPNPTDRDVEEHRIVERRDGSLWMLVRTKYGIGESVSHDRGRTWSDVKPMAGLRHANSRFYLGRLCSGNLLLIKHGPIDQNVGRLDLRAFISSDEGATWQGGLPISKQNRWFSEGHRGADGIDRYMSYPDAIQTLDGRIYCIYDFSRTYHETLFLAVFTEEDALAGKDVSGKVDCSLVVSSAGPNGVKR